MIPTGEKIRVWLTTGLVELRKGHDGLAPGPEPACAGRSDLPQTPPAAHARRNPSDPGQFVNPVGDTLRSFAQFVH